jgi:hypothetical protein
MRRHRARGEGPSWVGGWWIAPGASRARVERLALGGGRVELVCAEPSLRVVWRPFSQDAHDAASFCSGSGGSATQAFPC